MTNFAFAKLRRNILSSYFRWITENQEKIRTTEEKNVQNSMNAIMITFMVIRNGLSDVIAD